MTKAQKQIWMIATAPGGKGGIASVLRQYEDAGLFANGAIRLLESHHGRHRRGKVLPFLKACSILWPALVLGRVSVVHAHVSHGGSFWRKFLLILPAFVLRVPVLAHLHSGSLAEFYAQGSRWRQACIRLLFRRSFRVIALSPAWARWVHQIQPLAQASVVFNSVALPSGATLDTELSAPPTIVYLGRIADAKGSFDLLRAFAQVHLQMPDSRLLIGGDGEVDRFQAEVRKLKLDHAVRFEGWVDEVQKNELFKAAWVFALPSYQEGLPMSILEAMAYGRCVVSCPVGGIPDAVEHGHTGVLLSPGDVPALAQSLQRLLSDRALAGSLGQAGRQRFLLKFSHEANLPKLIALYEVAGATVLPKLSLASQPQSAHVSQCQ